MKRLVAFTIIILTLVLLVTLAWAQIDRIQLPRYALVSGDRLASEDGRFEMDSAIGQAVIGRSDDGERFEVEIGFLAGIKRGPSEWQIYLPLLTR